MYQGGYGQYPSQMYGGPPMQMGPMNPQMGQMPPNMHQNFQPSYPQYPSYGSPVQMSQQQQSMSAQLVHGHQMPQPTPQQLGGQLAAMGGQPPMGTSLAAMGGQPPSMNMPPQMNMGGQLGGQLAAMGGQPPMGTSLAAMGGQPPSMNMSPPLANQYTPISNNNSTEVYVINKDHLLDLVQRKDPKASLDPEVEDLVVLCAEEFIHSVTEIAAKLAKHRKSNTLEPKDIQLNLEKEWNIRIPGFTPQQEAQEPAPKAAAADLQRRESVRRATRK